MAAIPDATTSASFEMAIFASMPRSVSAARIAVSMKNPLSCCRFGESSITPFRIMPGNASPTAVTGSTSASALISSASLCTSSSDGTPRSVSAAAAAFPRAQGDVFGDHHPDASGSRCLRHGSSPLESGQLVQAVERRGFVALRQRRVVENRLDEIVDRSLKDQHRLADVQQFARAVSNNVYAEQLPGFPMENDFQPPGGVAADLSARDLAIIRQPDFVRHVFFGQLLFRFSDEGDLGNREDAVRVRSRIRMHGLVASVRGGDAALLHGD